MLIEKNKTDALKDYLAGKKVRVHIERNDGSMEAKKIEDLLPEDDHHYLVDEPIHKNPEIKQSAVSTTSHDQEEVEAEESPAPP